MIYLLSKKSKFFFSILFFTLILIPIVSIKGEATPIIESNWLYTELGAFQDKTPHSWENKIQFASGGYDLLSFENLGIVASTDELVVYKSAVQFGLEITANTYAGISDSFTGLDLAHDNGYTYFSVIHTGVFGIHLSSQSYSVHWNSVEFDSFRNHNYDGVIPITVGIKDITSKSGAMALNGVLINFPEMKADVLQVKVQEVRPGVVGSYEDIFTDISGISEGKVELISFDEQLPGPTSLINYYNSQDLGFHVGNVMKGMTYQNMEAGGSQKGATFDNVDPANNEAFTFNLFSLLTPEAYETVQYNTIKYAGILHDVFTGFIVPTVGPATKVAPLRRVAVKTVNPFVHWDLTVEVEFYATIASTAKLTESILSDPFLERGDWVWDTSVVGDYEVQVILPNVLTEIIMGIIIGIIVIVVIAAILLWIFFKKMRRSSPNINVNISK